jgi:hypothetical protein
VGLAYDAKKLNPCYFRHPLVSQDHMNIMIVQYTQALGHGTGRMYLIKPPEPGLESEQVIGLVIYVQYLDFCICSHEYWRLVNG